MGGDITPQVRAWIRQIRKELASGLDLVTAAAEARLSFEGLTGEPLTSAQKAAWTAAREEIARAEAQVVRTGPLALRRPRRPAWYRGPQADDANWPALRAHLTSARRWSGESVDSLDGSSTEILSLLEDPSQPSFRGRGMVVGYVQSGKTANMLAVAAKAADAGYRFVIFLSGLTNALRLQTQRRFESDLRERNPYGWHLHTTQEDAGDFRTPPNRWFSVMDPVQVAIVKKNVTPLRRLIETIEKTPPALRERMPVLILDDECDQASVNASGSQLDITAINGLLRRLLALLPRVQYAGYTATPFANVLINPSPVPGQLDDLYPEDFIVALPRPEGYSGADSLFGEEPSEAGTETTETPGADMIREVPEADAAWVRPPSLKGRDGFMPTVPPSLATALDWFVLATATRRARGQAGQHSSMLIHTTVYTITHRRLAAAVEGRIEELRNGLALPATLRRLRQLWESEQRRVQPETFGHDALTFGQLEALLPEVLRDIDVAIENSASDSRLDFTAGPRTCIVVGGSVLARGLTIEGLSVSYFVRSSSQYDTLLQMGRWFGFRKGYEDLPRIWMTADLAAGFRDLSLVEAELRTEITQYAERDLTPADFAIRIRQIPGMTITAASKMIAAETCDVSFSGEHLQTIRFPTADAGRLRDNWSAAARLADVASQSATPEGRPQGRLFRNVPLEAVTEFLKSYSASDKDRFGSALLAYIEAEAKAPDAPFRTWHLGIVEPADGDRAAKPLGGFGPVAKVLRSKLGVPRNDGLADIKALMSRRDVLIDVPEDPEDDRSDDWSAVKGRRQAAVGDRIPLLLLYAIDRVSAPAPGSRLRVPLDAPDDVLGIGLVLPDRGERKSYVRVRLPEADAGEDLLADIGDIGNE
jgi:hypothetical protein